MKYIKVAGNKTATIPAMGGHMAAFMYGSSKRKNKRIKRGK